MYQIEFPEIALGVILLGVLQFLGTLLISSWLKADLQKQNYKFLENLKWEFKAREQAQKVAEYMVLACNLKEQSSEEEYAKANTLAWELAMWLPENVYKSLGKAITKPDELVNPLSIVIDVRKVLLGNSAGNITMDEVFHHAPGIGGKS